MVNAGMGMLGDGLPEGECRYKTDRLLGLLGAVCCYP